MKVFKKSWGKENMEIFLESILDNTSIYFKINIELNFSRCGVCVIMSSE
jgi:hypothetical protein